MVSWNTPGSCVPLISDSLLLPHTVTLPALLSEEPLIQWLLWPGATRGPCSTPSPIRVHRVATSTYLTITLSPYTIPPSCPATISLSPSASQVSFLLDSARSVGVGVAW